MLESSFLSSTCSPWDSDLLQDFGQFPDTLPLTFGDFDLGLELGNGDEIFAQSGSSPEDLYSSSSEADYLLLDKILPVSDTFVSQILDHNVTGFSDLDFLTSDTYNTSKPQYNQNISTDSDGRAFQSGDPFDWVLGTKLWSALPAGEQLLTLHALSDIVTYHMDLQSQIRIIRIIDPKAKVEEKKEFPLNSTNLNDAKLRKIKQCIRNFRHCLQGPLSNRSSFSDLNTKKSNCKKLMSRKTNLKYSRTKRKQKKQKVTETPEKQKRLNQSIKELNSGYFVFEKVIKIKERKINNNKNQEDEDVDILD